MKRSVAQLRRWSRNNPWLRAAINLRRQQVSRARWDIVDLDGNSTPNQKIVEELRYMFRHPNSRGDSFRSFIEPVVEDLLVLDQGCIEVELTRGSRVGATGSKKIANLWPKDAGFIAFDQDWDGTKKNDPRYFELDATGKIVAEYRNDEMVVLIHNPVTYSPLGLSPLEVLAETIEADLAAAAYNSKSVMQAAPPGIIDLGEGIRPDQVDQFKAYWEAEIGGKSMVAIVGGGKGVKWTPLGASNRDMQFMEWQIYLARKICAVFGVQPQDIGISFDVNRSSAEVGAAFTADNGIAPLLDLIAEYLTREIIWRFDETLRFAYTDVGRASQAVIAEYYKAALGGLPWLRINDALKERGQDGIGEYGDEIWVMSPKGYMPMSLYIEYLEHELLGETPDEGPDGEGPDESGPEGPDDGDGGDTETSPEDATDPETMRPENPQMGPNQQPADQKAAGKPVITCDIDGTLTTASGPIENTVDFLLDQADEFAIYILTARSESKRSETEAMLNKFDVPYDRLIMNDTGEPQPVFKKRVMKELMANNDIAFAIENDEDVLAEYRKLGVKTMTPAQVPDDEEETEKGLLKSVNLTVPNSVKVEAARGLVWRKQYSRGGIGPGQRTARMLIGNRMTLARVKKMGAYLARHEVDKQGEGFSPGEPGYPSAGRIAWALWGGDAGKSWTAKVIRSAESQED
jgi:HK97 family phage portal protein